MRWFRRNFVPHLWTLCANTFAIVTIIVIVAVVDRMMMVLDATVAKNVMTCWMTFKRVWDRKERCDESIDEIDVS